MTMRGRLPLLDVVQGWICALFCGLFHGTVSIQNTWRRMVGCLQNIELETTRENGRGLIELQYKHLHGMTEEYHEEPRK
jgi:hypothetical protein